MDEKGLEGKIEGMMFDIVSGIIRAAEVNAKDPMIYLFDELGIGNNGNPESSYRKVYNPAHWYLMKNGTIDIKDDIRRGEEPYWYLKNGSRLDVKKAVSDIMGEYGLFLKTRYLGVHNEDEMKEKLSADSLRQVNQPV